MMMIYLPQKRRNMDTEMDTFLWLSPTHYVHHDIGGFLSSDHTFIGWLSQRCISSAYFSSAVFYKLDEIGFLWQGWHSLLTKDIFIFWNSTLKPCANCLIGQMSMLNWHESADNCHLPHLGLLLNGNLLLWLLGHYPQRCNLKKEAFPSFF